MEDEKKRDLPKHFKMMNGAFVYEFMSLECAVSEIVLTSLTVLSGSGRVIGHKASEYGSYGETLKSHFKKTYTDMLPKGRSFKDFKRLKGVY